MILSNLPIGFISFKSFICNHPNVTGMIKVRLTNNTLVGIYNDVETIQTEKIDCVNGLVEINIYNENDTLIDISDYTIKNIEQEDVTCKAQIIFTL